MTEKSDKVLPGHGSKAFALHQVVSENPLDNLTPELGKFTPDFLKAPKVPPPSPTLQCVISLTIQYFVLYTLLQILRTVNQFTGNAMLGWQKVLEAACTTVTYAPSLSCLFLGCRMRAIQLTQGETDKYQLPQPWVQNAMYACTYAVLAQALLVLIVSCFTGETSVK